MIKLPDPQFSTGLFEADHPNDFAIETLHMNSEVSADGTVHIHNFFEILFYYGGTGGLTVNNSKSILNKNKIAFIPPFRFHKISNNEENKPYKRILVNFTPEYMNNLNKICDNALYLCFNLCDCCICFSDKEINVIEELFQSMLFEYNTYADVFSTNMIKADLMKLLTIASRNARGSHDSAYIENSDNVCFDLILKVAEFITRNYKDKITLDTLEQNFKTSKYTISRNFNKIMHMSISDYINGIRIHEAKKLILKSENNIAFAAYECGFETLAHFNRVFKSYVGMTAKEFIRSKKQELPNTAKK